MPISFDWTTLLPFVKAVAILVIGFIVVKLLNKGLAKVLEKTKVETMLHSFILHTVQVGLWIIILLSVLGTLGINTASVVTVLAACGAAIALALQGSLSNLAGGILVLVTRPFSDGDYISVGGNEGTVQNIDLLYTTILTADRKTVMIPNSSITNGTVTNFTKAGTRRIDIQIGVSYNTDVQKAVSVLTQMARAEENVLNDPEPVCYVIDHADSAVILELRTYCQSTKYWPTRFSMTGKMKATLENAGIEIPFPQMDVHLDK